MIAVKSMADASMEPASANTVSMDAIVALTLADPRVTDTAFVRTLLRRRIAQDHFTSAPVIQAGPETTAKLLKKQNARTKSTTMEMV